MSNTQVGNISMKVCSRSSRVEPSRVGSGGRTLRRVHRVIELSNMSGHHQDWKEITIGKRPSSSGGGSAKAAKDPKAVAAVRARRRRRRRCRASDDWRFFVRRVAGCRRTDGRTTTSGG